MISHKLNLFCQHRQIISKIKRRDNIRLTFQYTAIYDLIIIALFIKIYRFFYLYRQNSINQFLRRTVEAPVIKLISFYLTFART